MTVSGGTKEYNEAKKLCHKKKFDMTPRQKRTPKKKRLWGPHGSSTPLPYRSVGYLGASEFMDTSQTTRAPLGDFSLEAMGDNKGAQTKMVILHSQTCFSWPKKNYVGVWDSMKSAIDIFWHKVAYSGLFEALKKTCFVILTMLEGKEGVSENDMLQCCHLVNSSLDYTGKLDKWREMHISNSAPPCTG